MPLGKDGKIKYSAGRKVLFRPGRTWSCPRRECSPEENQIALACRIRRLLQIFRKPPQGHTTPLNGPTVPVLLKPQTPSETSALSMRMEDASHRASSSTSSAHFPVAGVHVF